MFQCEVCDKQFPTAMAINGHMRMHGSSEGNRTEVKCCCVITRKEITVSRLETYQNALTPCKKCGNKFRPSRHKKLFCSQSCSASFNNAVFVKRVKKIKPPKKARVKKVRSLKEIRAGRVATVQAYRARKYNATPPDADFKLIKKIYECCPEGYEVDHIVAIAAGGLHHQDNLQYLPAMVNRKKNKRQDYDRTTVIRWQDLIPREPQGVAADC